MNSEKENNDLHLPQILNLDDDFSIVKQFIDGDESAFNLIVKRHKEKVRNIIFMTLGSVDGVDDIAQEVFINVYRNLRNFRFESQFTTWLYRITINKCKDHLRKVKIRSIFSYFKDNEDFGYHHDHESKDISEIVQKAILKVPPKLRLPLLLKDIEGFSYQEIAESLGCEIGTVKSRIFRARESLRIILKPLEQELRS